MMNFQKFHTRNSCQRPRPLSSFKTAPRCNVTQQMTLYAPEATTNPFYSPGKRSLVRPESRTTKHILSLIDNKPKSRNSCSISRKNSSKRLDDSYFTETMEHYLGRYELKEQLGKGSFGVVYLAKDKLSQAQMAVKVYEKYKINHDPAKFKNIRREISIMQGIEHPHIAKFIRHTDSLTKISLVIEYCGRSSLFELVATKFPLDQELLMRVLGETLSAVAYLHNRNIVHRDIKAQNLLLTQDLSVKLIDFGFSIITNKHRKLSSLCGTPNYMAPQVLRKEEYVGEYADMWSFGILTYFLVEKRFPFRADNIKELTRIANHCKIQFRNCKDLFLQTVIRRCLRVNPEERVSAQRLLEEKWYKDQPATDQLTFT